MLQSPVDSIENRSHIQNLQNHWNTFSPQTSGTNCFQCIFDNTKHHLRLISIQRSLTKQPPEIRPTTSVEHTTPTRTSLILMETTASTKTYPKKQEIPHFKDTLQLKSTEYNSIFLSKSFILFKTICTH